jgi:cysteinyl-tRNA synthetase
MEHTAMTATLQVYNTLAGREEAFAPMGRPITMYVCGLTPKNEPHLGHARLFVVNDTVRRYLEYRGFPVRYVQNFTDIDDKIIAAGLREGIPPSQAARRYTESYFRDMDRLNVRRADIFTYVTEFIPDIISFIEGLIANGHAYPIEGGDVYFSVPSFPDYGKLSHRDADAMLAGARIEPDERKRDPRDFALWKAAKPGEPTWPSPWGPGRPGWHIECSTMAVKTLGEQIDIHGGGADLIFPHHENEIAQTESLTSRPPFARYWVHTGMMSLPAEEGAEGPQKIAHSGKFITIRGTLEGGDIPAPALRTYLLSLRYRDTLVFSEEALRATAARWRRWAETRATLTRLLAWATDASLGPSDRSPSGEAEATLTAELARWKANFLAAMDDDFNTSRALSAIDELVHAANVYAGGLGGEPSPAAAGALQQALAALEELTGVLGIALEETAVADALSEDDVKAIEALLAEREVARAAKNWPEADRIRAALDEQYHVVIKDTPQGATWSVKR